MFISSQMDAWPLLVSASTIILSLITAVLALMLLSWS